MNASISYYPANQHTILTDGETGSGFWSVAGKSLQFTHFEVPPNRHFSPHSHVSEQITYILEGALFFKIEEEVYRVSAGDCIVIPSNKQHSVWTENQGVKAVDAWAPINEKYLAIKK